MAENELAPKGGQILIYRTESGQTKIEVRLEGETLWLNQAGLAELYQTTTTIIDGKPVIVELNAYIKK